MSTGSKTKGIKGNSTTSIWPSPVKRSDSKSVREVKSEERKTTNLISAAPPASILIPKNAANISEQKTVINVPVSNFNMAINSESKSSDDNNSLDNLIDNVSNNNLMSASLQPVNSDPHPLPPNDNNNNSNAINVSNDKLELLQQAIIGLSQKLDDKIDHISNEVGQLSNEVIRNRRDSQLFKIRMDHTLHDMRTKGLVSVCDGLTGHLNGFSIVLIA